MTAIAPKFSRLIALGKADANELAALAALDRMLDPSWLIFHSRKPLAGRADIDTLIVAPHGVFVAELKNFRGAITIGNGASWQRRSTTGEDEAIANFLQGQAQRQAQQLKSEFKTKAQLHQVWIEPVVIFTHSDSRLDFVSSDAGQLQQLVFTLDQAKDRLEALCAQNRAKQRSVSRDDLGRIAAVLDQQAKLPTALVWPETASDQRPLNRQTERKLRERKRRTRQLLSILTLFAALLITIGIYMLIRKLTKA